MAGTVTKHLDSPDEQRTPDKTEVNVVRLGDAQVGRFTFAPGWRWSECVRPVVGTESCQMEHLGYAISGQIRVEHPDGTSVDISPGEAYRIDPDHDAWVISDEPFVAVEFSSADRYAKT